LATVFFYDSNTGLLYFAIAHIPGDEDDIEALGGLSLALHQAVNDMTTPRFDGDL
jgi:hypothetical protein